MARRYLVDPLPAPDRSKLPKDVSHHLSAVLRMSPGETITLFDGRGSSCTAKLVPVGRGQLEAETGPIRLSAPETGPRIHLGVALPKGRRLDLLFEQATALGAHAIHPILCHHSENRPSRPGRWRRIAAAAAGQSNRDFLPEIHEPCPLDTFLADPELPEERYLAHQSGPPLDRAVTAAAVLLVGPEGGFTREEEAAARDHGFEPRSLGPLILRVETAALAGAVLLGRPHGTG